jgi:Flp pilus assembly protein TadG
MHAPQRVRTFLSCRSGNVMAIAAACMPLLIGAAAVGVDTIQLTLAKRELQRAADASALAGAYALVQSGNAADAVDKDLALNNRITLSTTRVVQNAPTTGAYSGNTRAVRVVLTAQRTTPFMAFFSRSSTTVSAEATAAWVYNGKFCMIAKEDGNATGITFTGSTTVDLGCGVATNSTSANAVVGGGAASVKASPIAAMGGVPSSSAYVSPTVLLPYSPAQTDPFASLANPAPPTGCKSGTFSVQPNGSSTPQEVSTNVICYQSYDIKGTIDFGSNKTIYVAGGSLAFGSQADVTCSHCTFVFTGPAGTTATQTTASPIATLSMHGNAVLNVSAANSGTYTGLLMYQDPRAVAGNSVSINGNSASTFVGGFYFPKADLTFNGNTGMHTECIQMVARRLIFSGNSSVTNTCPTDGTGSAFDAIFVKLVG